MPGPPYARATLCQGHPTQGPACARASLCQGQPVQGPAYARASPCQGQPMAWCQGDESGAAAPRVGDEDLALVHREVARLVHLARRAAAHLIGPGAGAGSGAGSGSGAGLGSGSGLGFGSGSGLSLGPSRRRAALTGSPSSSSVAPMCRRKRRLSRSKTETRLLPHSATRSSSPATRSR